MMTATHVLPLLLLGAAPQGAPTAAPAPAAAMTSAPAMDAPGGMWKPYDYRGGSSKASQESIPSGVLVIIAYVILWAVVLGYVLVLAARQVRLRRELNELRRRLGPQTQAEGAPARTSGSETT